MNAVESIVSAEPPGVVAPEPSSFERILHAKVPGTQVNLWIALGVMSCGALYYYKSVYGPLVSIRHHRLSDRKKRR